MRFARIAVVLAALIPASADADVLLRMFAHADDAAPAPPAPVPTDDMTSWAGPARQTNLPELLKEAIQHTPGLAGAKLDIEIAEARIQQTQSRNDWQLRAELDVSRSTGGFFGGQEVDQSIVGQSSIDVFRVLPSGGTLTFHTGSTYNSTSFRDATADDLLGSKFWSHDLSAGFSQPLLRGRGKWLFEAQERRAKFSKDVAVLAKRVVAISTVQTVISAYWDLLLAERQVAITRSSLDLAKERLRITTIGADGGKIPRSEIPAVQQIIATREEDVLNGELNVLDKSIVLRRAVGMSIGKGELALRIGTDVTPGGTTFELGQLTDRAFAAAPELAQLAKQQVIATLDIEVTEKGLLPRLDAALTLGPTGQDTKFGTAWKNLVELDTFTVAGSLKLEHSFGQENVKGQARELRAGRQKLEVNATDLKMQIAQAMARAVAQLELARRRVDLSQRAIDLANQNITIETDRFNLGKATNFDVLNRQEELRQAELRKAQAMIDWHKAEGSVQALTGDILPTYGITVD